MANQESLEDRKARLKRAPVVLRAYARDVKKHGKPLDSGLPELLEFVAEELERSSEELREIEMPEPDSWRPCNDG